jgi:hypothetical protein
MLDRLFGEMDGNKNKMMTMEHFIDKYVPIRIQQQIGETLEAVGGRSIIQKLETFEMEKYKNLNEEVLDDEKHPELLDRAKKL